MFCATKTVFQDKLSMVLYEDEDAYPDPSEIDPSIADVMVKLKEKEEELISEAIFSFFLY